MFVTFRKTLCRLGGIRIGAGVRLKGGTGAMLAFLFAVLNLYWYLMLGALWMIYGAMWLMWKLFMLCVVKPIKWIFHSLPKWLRKKSFKGKSVRQSVSTQPTQPPSPVLVLITKNGNKFHLDDDCPSLRSTTTEEINIQKARTMGYTPCVHCAAEYFDE